MKSKFLCEKFSGTAITPIIEMIKRNSVSNLVPTENLNQDNNQSNTISSRDDTHNSKCTYSNENKIVRIDYESFECVKDLESILTKANKGAKELNAHIDDLKEETTKAQRRIEKMQSAIDSFIHKV